MLKKFHVSQIYPVLLLTAFLLVYSSCTPQTTVEVDVPPPPETRVEEVTEQIHGVEISDPYRWLEDKESEETQVWITNQNDYTDSILNQLPWQEKLSARLSGMQYSGGVDLIPKVKGNRAFYINRLSESNIPLLCMREGADGEEEILVDPRPVSSSGPLVLYIPGLSEGGKMMGYTVHERGAREFEIKIIDVDSRTELPDVLPAAAYTAMLILSDKSGYYFTRYEEPGIGLYYRAVGSEPDSERLVYSHELKPGQQATAILSSDNRYILLDVQTGRFQDQLYLMDLESGEEMVPLVTDIPALFSPPQFGEKYLYTWTNWEAPNGRILRIDPQNPQRENWEEIFPESDTRLLSLTIAGGKLFIQYLKDVVSYVEAFDIDGNKTGELTMPGIGLMTGISGHWDSDFGFFFYTSFDTPNAIYSYNFESGEHEIWFRHQVQLDSDDYEVKQVWYESADGAKVPMFVAHKTGVELNGQNPTLLAGYGAFLYSYLPIYNPLMAAWLESGGVFAAANIRGGGEFGEEWHRAGMLQNKQNSINDIIAAAEHLTSEKYTNPDKLAIMGGGHGSVVAGAALAQRPDLCAAVVLRYPLLDMLRYHKFPHGNRYVPEYGTADAPDQFEYLHKYSPYHNVDPEAKYPAVLLISGEAASSYPPLHALKMAALLQSVSDTGNLALLRYYTAERLRPTQEGRSRVTEEEEILSFLCWRLKVNM